MMQDFQAIRKNLPENILVAYRLGDFYEFFFNDAVIAAPIIGVALTKRGEVQMCGFPHHTKENYFKPLLAAGHRIAIAEPKGKPEPGKLLKREIVETLHPEQP